MITVLLSFSACSTSSTTSTSSTDVLSSSVTTEKTSVLSTGEVTTNLSKIDMSKWSYEEDAGIYYQVNLSYCETPADSNYETMGVYVPAEYFTATKNGDGTYTCTVNTETTSRNVKYMANTAPIVIPINTPGYAAQSAPTGYSSQVEEYCSEGFIYVYPGCRGRDAGAPAGVTDIKAAIRYTRYNENTIPGDMNSIYTFGMSGGGAQSAVVGASGDSSMYDDYLTSIGAVTGVSDAVTGAMCWCPITNLDEADEAYEWNLGITRTDLSSEDQAISDALANAYAEYINQANIKNEKGEILSLEASEEGIYQAGSYYDYLLGVVETSLNNFLSDTTFPYDSSSNQSGLGGRPDGATGGTMPEGMPNESGAIGDGFKGPDSEKSKDDTETDFTQIDDIDRSGSSTAAVSISGTYETAQAYIDALNAPYKWVEYDEITNTATITSMEDFVKAMKVASKSLGAFDQLDAGQGENTLFGYGDGEGAHFDATLAQIIKNTSYESEYGEAFEEDLSKTDSEGHDVAYRVNMYTPLYYLMDSYDGYQTSNVAKFWRIRTGIDQGDTSLSTEVNLALAAENYSEDTEVDFATVWGLGHTMAERTGDSTTNFIEWVNACENQR